MESVNCQTEENRPQDIKFTTDYPKTTFATLQTTNMFINNSSVPDNNKIMAQQVALQCWGMWTHNSLSCEEMK